MARSRVRNQKKSSARGPAELGVAPHGEAKVIEMPIRTDLRQETKRQNIAQMPNTRAGRLAPSVGGSEIAKIDRGMKKGPGPIATDTAKKSQRNTVDSSPKKNTRNTA